MFVSRVTTQERGVFFPRGADKIKLRVTSNNYIKLKDTEDGTVFNPKEREKSCFLTANNSNNNNNNNDNNYYNNNNDNDINKNDNNNENNNDNDKNR